DGLMLPLSELNRVRREWVAAMDAAASRKVSAPDSRSVLSDELATIRAMRDDVLRPSGTALSVLCRSLEQVQVALNCGVQIVYADFEDIRRYANAVQVVRESGTGCKILLATPRIQKAGEHGFFKLIENAEPDGVLVRNLGALHFFRDSRLRKVGDFSLNVA